MQATVAVIGDVKYQSQVDANIQRAFPNAIVAGILLSVTADRKDQKGQKQGQFFHICRFNLYFFCSVGISGRRKRRG